ncbi:hypothetical protein BLA29_002172 [Euroglyphus maynei]|uniref:Uncharacterized protein n=1 Tax=Euroglyphus maynei TaxID=6958 RepID=A0A1Y3B3Y2_EURMA|nr:hypothetical protein BLA29_002172 [Euroglyphus maynei]
MSSKIPLEPMKTITHVIFDMDGLILDTETFYEKAIDSVTKRYGRDYPFEVKSNVNEFAFVIID